MARDPRTANRPPIEATLTLWPEREREKHYTTLETVYKVAICSRGNLPYKQIYLTRDLMLLENVNWGIEISSP